MIAYDADVLSELLAGRPDYIQRATSRSSEIQAVPVIVIEEIVRGRLNMIRQAEAGKAKISLDQAYQFFQETIADFSRFPVLAYDSQADQLFQNWRTQKIRVGTHDMRIAAICVSHDATLISRNRQDFSMLPGLKVDYWI